MATHKKPSFSRFQEILFVEKISIYVEVFNTPDFLTSPSIVGRDFIHQMKLIVGILGTPSKEVLKLSHSDMVTKFIKGTGCYRPE